MEGGGEVKGKFQKEGVWCKGLQGGAGQERVNFSWAGLGL